MCLECESQDSAAAKSLICLIAAVTQLRPTLVVKYDAPAARTAYKSPPPPPLAA